MSHHIIEFKDVHFVYPDGTNALNGISFRITHGESVGIVGANGAGKTTLISHMNGCLLPSKGTITIGDMQLNKSTINHARERVGVVFQNPDDQLFMPTVFDDVAFGPLNLGMTEERVIERVDEALTTVGCLNLKDKPPHHLSMGQRRAVTIAGVIAMQPDILVMDEPAASLDPRSRRQLINLLKEFRHTKIIASHDLGMIMEVCERCILLSDGRIAADGKTREILLNNKLLEDNGLEMPQYIVRQLPNFNRLKEIKMTEIERLRHLLEHWIEHNREHVMKYQEWADKVGAIGEKGLSEILRAIATESERLEGLFKRAIDSIDKRDV